MNLHKPSKRELLKAQNAQVKKANNPDDFIEGAELKSKTLGRPSKKVGEVTKSVTVALTKTEQKQLDSYHKKLDVLLLDDVENDFVVNRSEVVKACSNFLSGLSEDELVAFFTKYQTQN